MPPAVLGFNYIRWKKAVTSTLITSQRKKTCPPAPLTSIDKAERYA